MQEDDTVNHNNSPQAIALLITKVYRIEQLLLAGKANPQQETDDLLTIEQAAEYLHLSKATLYLYVSKATIPVCKRSGSKRLWFSKQELTEWIKSGRKQTVEEIKTQVEQSLSRSKKGS